MTAQAARPDRGIWAAGFVVALGLHGGVAAIAIGWAPGDRSVAPPPAAMLIDLAPLPAAPTPVPSELPPAPQQTVVSPPPEPEPIPELPPELPKLDLPPPPQVIEEAVVLPSPPPPPKPRPRPRPPAPVVTREMPPEPVREQRPVETTPPMQTTTAPQAAPQAAPVAAAPRQDQPNVLPPSDALPTWRGALFGHLERLKRYPQAAQWRRQQGTVYLRFTMDRAGKVLRATIERSSSFDILDEEVLALIARAQPLPAPPDEIAGDTIELIVPVQFYIR